MKRLVLICFVVAAGILALSVKPAPATYPFVVKQGGTAAPVYPISHVVVIVQENRTIDNFFNGYPGANTVTTGKDSTGATITLLDTPQGIQTAWDPSHQPSDFYNACHPSGSTSATCAMDSFDKENCAGGCGNCQIDAVHFAYCKVNSNFVINYWNMVTLNGVLHDNIFQSNDGPSFASHLYLLMSQSHISNASNLAESSNDLTGIVGCANVGTVGTIDMTTSFPGVQHALGTAGCAEGGTITDLLDNAHLPWYWVYNSYAPTGDQALWAAPNNITHMCLPSGGACTNTIFNNATGPVVAAFGALTPQGFLMNAASTGTLRSVNWYIPLGTQSDHADITNNSSANVVANIVDAIGNHSDCTGGQSCWNNTAIIVIWDDWGGWYDHVAPPPPPFNSTDPYEYGPRVPMIVMSAYTPVVGTVSHTQGDSSCVNYFIEQLNSLPGPIGPHSIEQNCTDNLLTEDFNFLATPRPFSPV